MKSSRKFQNGLWPLDLAFVLLGSLVLFLVVRLLRFDNPDPIQNAWTYILGVPTVLISVSMLTHVFSNETVERSIQVGFLLSVTVHLVLALSALNLVLFGGFWASEETELTAIVAKERSRAPQYYEPPSSASSSSKPDYLKPTQTPSEKPTDVSAEIERQNEAAKLNLAVPNDSLDSRIAERTFELEKPIESTPLPTIASSAEKLDRPELSSRLQPKEVSVDVPKLEPSQRAELPEVNARSIDVDRPTEQDRTPNPTLLANLPKTSTDTKPQTQRSDFDKRSPSTTLVERDLKESMERAASSVRLPENRESPRTNQTPNRAPSTAQVPVPELAQSKQSAPSSNAGPQARADLEGRSIKNDSSTLSAFSSMTGPKVELSSPSSAGSRAVTNRDSTTGRLESQNDFLNDSRFQPGKPTTSPRTTAAGSSGPLTGSAVPLDGILSDSGSARNKSSATGELNAPSDLSAITEKGERESSASRASLSSLSTATPLPDLGRESLLSPREDMLTRGLGNRKTEPVVPDLRPSDFAPERFKRPDLAGPKVAASSVPIPTPAFTQRLKRMQEREGEAAAELGPLGPQTELAIERGLQFLAKYQRADGSWHLEDFDEPVKMRSPTAATALALLSFQGAGYTHKQFKYEGVCQGALAWLVSQQKSDGDLYVRTDLASNANSWLYSHAMATLALCEAYGMTQDESMRDNAQRAVNFLVASQDPNGGGWRYTPRVGSDTSVTGWVMMALKSAELAGLEVPKSVYVGINRWIENSRAKEAAHLYRYNWQANTPSTEHGRVPTPVMTSVGLLIRLYTGWKRDNASMKKGAEWLLERLPSEGTQRAPARDTYYWYYATQVIFHMGGESWKRWYGALYPMLIRTQVTEGEFVGSWEPSGPIPDAWGSFGGRLYVTTLNLLSLEVYYRHLPIYEATAD
jgi:hypothetical protein